MSGVLFHLNIDGKFAIQRQKRVNMEYHESSPEYSQEDIDRAFEEALSAAERLHKRLSSAAEDAGYVRFVVATTKPRLDAFFRKAQEDPSVYPMVASGVDYLKGLSNELNRLAGITDDFAIDFSPIANSAGTFGDTTVTVSLLRDLEDIGVEPIPPPPRRKSRNHYVMKLRKLDPPLADTYEEAWQTYLGTSSDSHRAALFMMRTLFDNFFAKIAPDGEVRASRHWRRKEGESPNQIWRSERIAYALEKNIHDQNRRSMLQAQSRQINALYEAANKAHDRGSLDEEKAARTLNAMDNFIRDWIDSLDYEINQG